MSLSKFLCILCHTFTDIVSRWILFSACFSIFYTNAIGGGYREHITIEIFLLTEIFISFYFSFSQFPTQNQKDWDELLSVSLAWHYKEDFFKLEIDDSGLEAWLYDQYYRHGFWEVGDNLRMRAYQLLRAFQVAIS